MWRHVFTPEMQHEILQVGTRDKINELDPLWGHRYYYERLATPAADHLNRQSALPTSPGK